MLTLETERLRFRQRQESDFDKVTEFFCEEENAKFVRGRKNAEESWCLMATYIGHYHLRGFSYPAVVEKSTDSLIGTIGLWQSKPWPELELCF